MEKLKKSYIVETFNLYIIRTILKLISFRFKDKGKVLIKSCDGIGDILVRTKLVEKIEKKYGKENVYILMQENYQELGKILGYKTIGYSRKERKNFIPRLKKMYKLNMLGFSKYINIEFTGEITNAHIFASERIGRKDLNLSVKRYNKYLTKSYFIRDKYVMKQIKEMGEFILDEKCLEKELMPDIRNLFDIKNESIVIAVGSTDRKRVCSPLIMKGYIEEILKLYSEKEVKLVGNGKLQEEYAKKLIIDLNRDKRIKNLVGKTSLKEVFKIVAESCIFIGFDSGLYNVCFSMRKKGIILFREKTGLFIHNSLGLKILTPKKINNVFLDKKYPNQAINSITKNEFKNALEMIKGV